MLRWSARILAITWGGFWVWFGLASGIAEGIGVFGVIRHAALPGLILLASAALACWRPKTGGILLIIEGIIIAAAYPLIFGGRFPITTVFYVLLTMALPPIAAGLLFLLDFRHTNKAPAVE